MSNVALTHEAESLRVEKQQNDKLVQTLRDEIDALKAKIEELREQHLRREGQLVGERNVCASLLSQHWCVLE